MNKTKRLIGLILAIVCCLSVASVLSSCDGGQEPEKTGVVYYVNYNNVKIQLDKDAESVLKALGTPKQTDNLGDCGGIGEQMKYTYSDITVNTLKEADGEKIHKISFTNDLVETPAGIFIGVEEKTVRDTYGKPNSENNGKLVYKSNDLELEIVIKEGSVSGINYRRVR